MENAMAGRGLVTLGGDHPIWERFFNLASLVLVATREEDGSYDIAPKHMATPLGWGNYFGFVCTPRHATYGNAKREGFFTVSYPRPSQVLLASFASAPRCEDTKPSLELVETFPATKVEGMLVEDAYLHLECETHQVYDDFGPCSLITGRIVVAHVHESALRRADKDDRDLLRKAPLLAYLSPGRYAKVQDTEAFPYHSGYRR